MIKLEGRDEYVDLTKLQYLLEHYKSMSALDMMNKKKEDKSRMKMDDDTQIYFYHLTEEFSNNINGIV